MTPSLDELVKQGEGSSGCRRPRRRHLHVQEHRQQLPGHHARRRPADQHRHRLRGGRDQGPVRAGQQGPVADDHLHPGPSRPRGRVESVQRSPASRRSPRPTIRDVREYWRHLHPFYVRRIMTLWGAFMDVESRGGRASAGAGAHRRRSSTATHSNSAVGSSSSTRHRAARPPTPSWCGCPNTAPSSSAT